jgi:hypothetical protein
MRGDGETLAVALEAGDSEASSVIQMRFEIPFSAEDGRRAIKVPVTPLI